MCSTCNTKYLRLYCSAHTRCTGIITTRIDSRGDGTRRGCFYLLSDCTVVVIRIHVVIVTSAIDSSIIFIRVCILICVAIRIRVGIVASAIDVLVYITVASTVDVLIDRTSACVVISIRVVCASAHDIVIRVRGGIVVRVVASTIDRSVVCISVSARVVTGAIHGTSIDIRIIIGVRIGIGVDVRVVISVRASIRRRIIIGIGVDIRVAIGVRACGGIDVRISICVGIGASYRAGASSRAIGFDIARVVEFSVSIVCDFRKGKLSCRSGKIHQTEKRNEEYTSSNCN